jgi:acetyl-CoA carboxylase biotin carboxyl carrier protein
VTDVVELDRETIHALLEAFDASEWNEMTVTVGDDRLYVSRASRSAVGPAPAAGPREPVQPTHATPPALTGVVVESPSVGLFWRSPSPGAPPFVEVGAEVAAGDTLAIVEVMKLMNQIVAPGDGVVRAILAENGQRVEYAQPLFAIDPDGT